MKLRMAAGVSCMMLLAAVVWAQAQETGGAEKPKKPALARLTQPWNRIAGLSDDQKTQIRQIHAKALAEIRAIEAKERGDIMALLSDEQKAEAERLFAEQKKPRARATAKEGEASNEKKVQEKAGE
jgi:hypothetical protein